MNTRLRFPRLLIGVLALGMAPALTAADFADHIKNRPTQFSCDMVMTTDRGPTNMHMVQDGDRKRSEVQRGSQNMVIIIRPDQKKMFMLMVDRKMAMEMPYDQKKAQDDVEQLMKDPAARIEALGSETIEGVACDKFATTSGEGRKSTVWIAAEQHTTQRWVSDDGKMTVVFSNYRIGAPDASAFEVPADYKRMAMPAGAVPPGAGAVPPGTGAVTPGSGARPPSPPPSP